MTRSSDDLAGITVEPVAGWGRFPVRRGRVVRPEKLAVPEGPGRILPRGLGRAYGDSAVPAALDDLVVDTTRADRIEAFDEATGLLTCEAGLSLAEVLRVFLPRGWFPPVTPGTKFVTIGGCVASDVHGKNHHVDGSFGRFVEQLTLATADGHVLACGPDREPELFRATVGGMGLTGLITQVTLRLRPVESPWIFEETAPVGNLREMLRALRTSAAEWPYTVGWIDGLAQGAALGRGVMICGRHATRAEAAGRAAPHRPSLPVPIDAPGWLLNPLFMKAANSLYYHGRGRHRRGLVSHETFFYPLDALTGWNRLYGSRGFLQYQCVIPRAAGEEPIAEILARLAKAGAASFLAVIKDCGPEAPYYLSFPMEGVTLALDVPYRGPATEALMHELNRVVIAARGRVYLAKDAVTRSEDCVRMLPRLDAWHRVRDRWDPKRRFRSAQSVRLLGDPL